MFRIFLFVLCLIVSFPLHAQTVVDELKRPMPEFEPMLDAAFESQTVLREDVPFDDAYLSYQVRLPKNWKKLDSAGASGLSKDNKIFGEIVRYHGPVRVGDRSTFDVQVVGLDYQLTAEQWLIQYILEGGNTLRGIETHNERRVEAIYVIVKGDVTFAVRSVAIINGKRVVVASYTVPMQHWGAEKQMQAKILDSFRLTNPDNSLAEEVEPYQFLDIAQTEYPVSWELRAPPIRSIDRMHVELLNIVEHKSTYKTTRALNGKMEVHLSSAYVVESLEAEIETFKVALEEKGVALGELINEPKDFLFDDAIEFGYTAVYSATDKEQENIDYELWLTIMAAGDYYYFLTLLTPSRTEDYFKWARNTQTFRVVNSLTAPLEQGFRD